MSAKIIEHSHVVVKPIRFDIDYNIVPYLRNNPYQKGIVYADELEVTILKGLQPFSQDFKFNSSAIYDAKIIGAQTWLAPYSNKTNLVINLFSPELEERRQELLQFNSDLVSEYKPHITLIYDIPNPTQKTRWWVNEILTKFNEGPESKYYGNTIRLGEEQAKDSVIVEDDSMPVLVTKPF